MPIFTTTGSGTPGCRRREEAARNSIGASASMREGDVLSMDWIRKALAHKNFPARKKTITQYGIDTTRMAQDVRRHIRCYVRRILQVKTTDDAVVLIKLFRRILPALIEQA
ncbi:MAG: hypothetical protein JSW26_20610, partial [Desulfobacterales bacterium]